MTLPAPEPGKFLLAVTAGDGVCTWTSGNLGTIADSILLGQLLPHLEEAQRMLREGNRDQPA